MVTQSTDFQLWRGGKPLKKFYQSPLCHNESTFRVFLILVIIDWKGLGEGGCASLRSIITKDINDIINDITDNHYSPQTKLREGNVLQVSVCLYIFDKNQ